MAEPKHGELWRHYKGTTYIIDTVAEHSETGQTMVIYRDPNLEPAKHWARPLSMWHEKIEGDVHRFEPVTAAPATPFRYCKEELGEEG